MSKISELSDGGVIQGGDTLIAVRSGGNVKVTYGGSTTANIDGGNIDGTTIGGTTPAAGNFTTGSFTGDVSFGDNDKAIFGAGSDLQIYHDSTTNDSIITESGAGNLVLQGNALRLTNTSGVRYLQGNSGAEVNLWHNGSKKLETTSTGIDVTGTVTADGLTVDGSTLYVDATNNRVGFRTTTPNDTVQVNGGALSVTQSNSAYADEYFAKLKSEYGSNPLALETRAGDVIQASNYGQELTLLTGPNSTGTVERLNIDSNGDITFYDTDGTTASFVYDASSGLTINEAGADRDFRVESDSNSHMLFINAGLDQVAIGSGSISAPSGYHFFSYGAGSGARSAFVHGAGDGGIVVSGAAGGSAASVIFGNNWGTNGATFSEEWRLFMDGADDSLNFNYAANAATAMSLTSGGTFIQNFAAIFNESGGDQDFRVESDSNTHALFVDAGSNTVSVGSSSSDTRFNVYNNTNGSAGIHVENLDTGTAARTMLDLRSDGGNFFVYAAGSNYNGVTGWADSGIVSTSSSLSGGIIMNAQAGGIEFQDSLVNRFEIKDSGEIVANETGQDRDFRVESDSNSHMLYVDAGSDEVVVGGTGNNSGSGTLALNTGSSKHGKTIQSVGQTTAGEAAIMAEGTIAVNTTSLGTKLSIPLFSQPNVWRRFTVEMMFVSGEYNDSGNAGYGTATLKFASLTSISSLVLAASTGNVASVSSTGTNVEINFTSGYTSGLANHEGVLVYYRVLSSHPSYFQAWNATLN